MRVPRMTTQRWMIVVVVVAVTSDLATTAARRWTHSRRWSTYHRVQAVRECLHSVESPESRRQRENLVKRHFGLAQWYEKAAYQPWLSVTPCSPPP
jgi:hypothetical protein